MIDKKEILINGNSLVQKFIEGLELFAKEMIIDLVYLRFMSLFEIMILMMRS